ncbi:MAG: LamG-like jellyroll fold domain-containing protein [Bacteriovoracaceae bacterium]
MIRVYIWAIFLMISCVPVEQAKQIELKDRESGASQLRPVRVTNLSNTSGDSSTLSWSWGCDAEGPCEYRYLIDRNPFGVPTGEFDFSNIGQVLNGQGTFYIHVQARSQSGAFSEIVHAKGELLNLKPILENLSDDFVVRKSKTWSWSCRYLNSCVYRFKVLQSPDFTFESEPFSSQSFYTLNNTNGKFYLFVQAKNITNNQLSDTRRVQVVLDNSPPLIIGLANDSKVRAVKTWNWECSSETCDFRFAISQSPLTLPFGPYTSQRSYTLTGVNGRYYIHVQAKDRAGNETVVSHYYVDMDSLIPEVLGLENDTVLRKDKQWSWSCSEANCQYRFNVNQTPNYSFEQDVPFSSNNSASINNVNGVYYIHVQAKNLVTGKIGDTTSAFVNFDNLKPVVSFTSGDDLTAQIEKEWNWFCSGGEFCDFRYAVSEDPNIAPTGDYTSIKKIEVSGDSGTKYIAVQARDLAGNESEVSRRKFIISTALPRPLNIFSDFSVKRVKNWSWVCNLTNCQYRYAVTNSSIYSFPDDVPFGPNNFVAVEEGNGNLFFHLQAKDITNNIVGELYSYSFTLDNLAPNITIDDDDPVQKSSKTWEWECDDDVCESRYAIDQNPLVDLQTVWSPWQNNKELTVSELTGKYYLHLQVRDGLQNESVPITRSFELYNQAPEVTGLDDADNLEPVPSVSFQWGCDGVSCIYRSVITDSPDFIFSNQSFNNSNVISKSDGNDIFYLYVQAKDLISNKIGPVKKVSFNINSTKPTAIGVNDRLIPAAFHNLAWNCGALLCSFRFKLDINPDVDDLSDLSFSTNNNVSYDSRDGLFYFYIQARNVDTGVIGDIQRYKFAFDNTPPQLIGPSLVNSLTPVISKEWNWSCENSDISDLLLRLPFENNYNDFFEMFSGVGENGVTFSPEKKVGQNSVYFPGTADARVTIPSSQSLIADNPKSFSFWIKGDSVWEGDGDSEGTDAGKAAIITSSSQRFILAFSGLSGRLELQLSDGSSSQTFLGATNILDEQWHHVVVSIVGVNGGAVKMFIDGDLEFSSIINFNWTLDSSGDDLLLGDSTDTFWEEFKGYLDQINLYNKVISQEEVNNLFINDPHECTYRFVLDTDLTTIPGGGYSSVQTTSIGAGNSLYYLHLQALDVAGNESAVNHYYQQIDNTEPSVLGLTNDGTETNLKGFSWVCNKNNCSYRFTVNQSPSFTFSNESYVDDTSFLYGEGNGTFYFHIQSKDKFTDIEGDVQSYSFVMDTIAPNVTGLVDDPNIQGAKEWMWDCDEANCLYSYIITQASSFTPTIPFENTTSLLIESVTGTYYIHVRAKDSAGNIGPVFSASVTLDQNIPVIVGLEDDTTPRSIKDWVWSCDDADTNNCEYRFEISQNSVADLDDDIWGDASSVSLSQGEGVYYLHVQVRKKSNQALGGVKSVSVTLDNTDPVVTGIPADSGTVLNISWNWACVDTTTCQFRYLVDQVPTTSDLGQVQFSNTSSLDFTETYGEYYIHVQAIDELGRLSPVVHGRVFVDSRVPIVNVAVGPNPNIASNNVSINWDCDIVLTATCEFRYEITQSNTPDLSDDPWGTDASTNFDTGDGTYFLHIQPRNTNNNLEGTIASVPFIMDTTPPNITGGEIIDDLVVKTSKTWNWGCDEQDCIMRYAFDQNPTTDGTTAWSTYEDTNITYSTSGETGRYYIHVQTADALFNESVVSSAYVDLDNTPPAFLGISNDPTPTKSKTWNLACDPASGVGDCEFRFIIDTNPTTDISGETYGPTNTATQPSGDGTYYIHVQARKPVNGLESSVEHFSAILDNTIPTDTINSQSLVEPTISPSTDVTPVISGTITSGAEDGGSVQIYNDASCATEAVGSGVISATAFTVNNITYASDTTDDGTISFYGQVVDIAGNEGSCQDLSLSYTLTTIPTLSTASLESGVEGDSLVITGTEFSDSGNVVTIDGQTCAITAENSTSITCTVPAPSSGTGSILTTTIVASNAYGNIALTTPSFTYLGTSAEGLKLWLDGNDTSVLFETSDCSTTPATDTNPVGCWKDKSGSSNDVIQDTNPPVLDVNSYNSKNGILFDGGDDFLEKTSATDFSFLNGEYSYFVVVAYDNTQSGYGSPLNTSGAAIDKGIALYANELNGKWEDWVYTVGPSNNKIDITATANLTPQLLSSSYKVDDERVLSINGVETSYTTSSINLINNSLIRIGNGNSQFFKGHVLEVLIYNKKLGTSDRDVINSYLKNKWGITP